MSWLHVLPRQRMLSAPAVTHSHSGRKHRRDRRAGLRALLLLLLLLLASDVGRAPADAMAADATTTDAMAAAGIRPDGTFLQELALHRELPGPPSRVIEQVALDAKGQVVVETDQGQFTFVRGAWTATNVEFPRPPVRIPTDPQVRQWARGADNQWAAATDQGLFEWTEDGSTWKKLQIDDGQGRLWAATDVRGVAYDAQDRLWFATLAGVGCRDASGWRFFTGREGLPYNDFTCCAAGADGSLWFGTRRGAIRYLDGQWAYRQGKRWLPHDEVRAICVGSDGTTWLATADGLGCIARQPMALAEKARFYEDELDQYIQRTPYGYVSEVHLPVAGSREQVVKHDSDNDGLWTAMYGASQCYAYAVTKSPHYQQRARRAFEALRFLQQVTQGGVNSPPRGYVARTILPASGPNPNEGRLQRDLRAQAQGDRLWKVYSPRWPLSADRQWYWKSDTSSDELDGHYFFYALYYDLAADTHAEKERVREVVADLTDHLVTHDFVLQDHDGRPTRWGMFRPSALNGDFDWVTERGLNSLSMLSYLATAHHVTGQRRFADAAERLQREHGYHMNALVPKVQQGVGSGNHSDDEMAVMSLYNIVKYTPESPWRRQLMATFYWYWSLEQPERNPFFHFAYAAFGQGQTVRDPFAANDISPWGGWLEDSLRTLVDFPLDRVDWGHTNSHRLDLVRLRPQYGRDRLERLDEQRGYRVDGKVLPVSERHFNHWNTDPYELDYGGQGHTLASGTVFLLPYYMGRYHGFIEE